MPLLLGLVALVGFVALVAGCRDARPTGREIRLPDEYGPEDELNVQVHQALFALLRARSAAAQVDGPSPSIAELDASIHALVRMYCGGKIERNGRWIQLDQVPVDQLYPMDHIDDAVAVGCTGVLTQNGSHTGPAFMPTTP